MSGTPVRPQDERLTTAAAETSAVVVTCERPGTLEHSLAALAAQTPALGHLVVVDNAADAPCAPRVAQLVAACGVPATLVPSHRNLGGAGGFALGMLHALARGAAYLWLADDDGRPGSQDTLATLHRVRAERGLALVSPAVVDAAEPARLAFPTRRDRRVVRRPEEFGGDFVPGFAALFNGALLTAECVDAVGVPDLRLFLRGDEIEIHRRLERSGLPFGTSTLATYEHPSGGADFTGPLGLSLPEAGPKRYYTFRNRGYLTAQPGRRLKAPLEHAAYAAHFLLRERDPQALADWARAVRDGRRERFRRFDG